MEISAAAATHVGSVRDTNEDALHAGARLFAVADGMGGHAAGEVASGMAVAAVAALDEGVLDGDAGAVQGALVDAVKQGNREVYADAQADPSHHGMGTTLTVAAVHSEGLLLAHVGDSRAYLLRDGGVQQLTTDHATGPFTLTRVVGLEPDVEVDAVGPVGLQPGDGIVLCSDGLTAVVGGEELPALLQGRDPQAGADALVQTTLERGAPDNVAVIVLALR